MTIEQYNLLQYLAAKNNLNLSIINRILMLYNFETLYQIKIYFAIILLKLY